MILVLKESVLYQLQILNSQINELYKKDIASEIHEIIKDAIMNKCLDVSLVYRLLQLLPMTNAKNHLEENAQDDVFQEENFKRSDKSCIYNRCELEKLRRSLEREIFLQYAVYNKESNRDNKSIKNIMKKKNVLSKRI